MDRFFKYSAYIDLTVVFIECFTTTFLRAHSWLNWVHRCLYKPVQIIKLHCSMYNILCYYEMCIGMPISARIAYKY